MHIEDIEDKKSDQYGVIIDAGSSGSRVYVYRWQDPSFTLKEGSDKELKSVPQIYLNKDWTTKTSPGLSSFEKQPEKAFKKHVKPLLEYAEKLIPKEKVRETPVFIQATAGMRLLPKKRREKILKNVCADMQHSTNFLIKDCELQVQIIDGETEGLYGWTGLNYLLGNFNEYDVSQDFHPSYGFMDMGGASAQIAFVPSNIDEIKTHDDDISTITLKSINGDTQNWRVFVSTWLGFGANQARMRYLAQLINALPENTNEYDDDDFSTLELTDPCMLRGSRNTFKFKDKEFQVSGSGNYEHCLKSIYPLLLKDLPCMEEPCLFNGVHAPQIDFNKDKFVGTSEFWYTANDVFKIGGEYNFNEFSQKVKEFCEAEWDVVKDRNEKGMYNNIPTQILLESCFKANWVLNVLHEGFDMPRVGIELPAEEHNDDADEYIPVAAAFQSADSINGQELSWTLGRIVLYSSSLIESDDKDHKVGILPSDNEINSFEKSFIPGSIGTIDELSTSIGSVKSSPAHSLLIVGVLIFLWILVIKLRCGKRSLPLSVGVLFTHAKSKFSKFKYSRAPRDTLADLEEGFSRRGTYESDDREGFQFRSRSMMNLNDSKSSHEEEYPLDERSKSATSSPSINQSAKLRTAFSLADFSKFTNPRDKERKNKPFI
ncbi:LAFE_0G11276g1_1 [Lachancea fermentati]|uniref:LAFE_0G11276g1_1 n=1 Tax=Lachancea fermentati TaxID=4955 RepID=A0A1G4MIA2_LACFM|nr:LAFE_0G11276g1_1 [Lachancea fermentati]